MVCVEDTEYKLWEWLKSRGNTEICKAEDGHLHYGMFVTDDFWIPSESLDDVRILEEEIRKIPKNNYYHFLLRSLFSEIGYCHTDTVSHWVAAFWASPEKRAQAIVKTLTELRIPPFDKV